MKLEISGLISPQTMLYFAANYVNVSRHTTCFQVGMATLVPRRPVENSSASLDSPQRRLAAQPVCATVAIKYVFSTKVSTY